MRSNARSALQRGLAERNAEVPEDQRIQVRIGINLGEVIVEGDDRYGEGVNIAARLEQLAEPGGICVSGKVAKEVEKKLAFGFEPMGEQKVKNIAEPVQAFRVKLDGMPIKRIASAVTEARAALAVGRGDRAAGWCWSSRRGSWFASGAAPAPSAGRRDCGSRPVADGKPSLVVLPFANLSDDKEQGYLADGITEDLTTELARVPGLFVISRNAAFTYKGKAVPPAQIAKELGVRYILEGSTRRVGDDMRINAQLIDAETGGHLWAERFDGPWAEVFALQDKVVGSVAGALKLRLVSGASGDGRRHQESGRLRRLSARASASVQRHAGGLGEIGRGLRASPGARPRIRPRRRPARLDVLERRHRTAIEIESTGHFGRRGKAPSGKRDLTERRESLLDLLPDACRRVCSISRSPRRRLPRHKKPSRSIQAIRMDTCK